MPDDEGLFQKSSSHGHDTSIYGTNQEHSKHDSNSEVETAISSSLTKLKVNRTSPVPDSLPKHGYSDLEVSMDIIGNTIEPLELAGRIPRYNRIKLCGYVAVTETRKRDKGPGYQKMADRQVPNPFRRYGSLKTLHGIGGWVTPKGTDKRHEYVKMGTKAPKRPTGPEFGLHKEVLLSKDVVTLPAVKTNSSQEAILVIANQIKKKVPTFETEIIKKCNEKRQPLKANNKKESASSSSSTTNTNKRTSH
ncbi:unnamed protein product [Bursaphelenchus okinawaensis]|uniref:Uncharacterized protein n=1 Tax=Bursaphelenchus okinawaensis TaxID=465554 RepID=A0A811L543_9BILA|nr:unnamed protein product [Bursaphelenchus okinawaensis]CAG9119791.1 unnamed protein product [Bursaphelenchus okinawaensis]